VDEMMLDGGTLLRPRLRANVRAAGWGNFDVYNRSFSSADVDCRLERPSKRVALPNRRGHGWPDEFYKSVARVIRDLEANGDDYARPIAAANGVNRTTVHRWKREAIDRGFYPRASGQGKRAASY
ncbi:MAG TPA: hypothetical protein VEP49_02025, partial [Acidimicrobiia bacterium]|nr:hypothetical protein [Acidimicrobiia bacterium]